MVDVVPCHFDTYLLADVIAMWKMLFPKWMEYCFIVADVNNHSG